MHTHTHADSSRHKHTNTPLQNSTSTHRHSSKHTHRHRHKRTHTNAHKHTHTNQPCTGRVRQLSPPPACQDWVTGRGPGELRDRGAGGVTCRRTCVIQTRQTPHASRPSDRWSLPWTSALVTVWTCFYKGQICCVYCLTDRLIHWLTHKSTA